MPNAIKSLRRAIWGSEGEVKPQDIGEALRDLFTAFKQLPAVRVVRLQNFVWAPPFFIANETRPAAVLLGESSVAKDPASAAAGSVAYTYLAGSIRIDSIAGLTVGTAYDLSFVVIG